MNTSHSAPKSVIILGATGNVGAKALQIIQRHKEKFIIKTLIADGNNIGKFVEIAKEFYVENIIIKNHDNLHELKLQLKEIGSYCNVSAGQSAIFDAVTQEHDICISAISGIAGLLPTMAAIPYIKNLALANKEGLICSGDILLDEVRKHGVNIIPVDTNLDAISQLFADGDGCMSLKKVKELFLTMSQSKYQFLYEELHRENAERRAEDIYTVISKALDMIQASYLFNIDIDHISLIYQSSNIIRGVVRYANGGTNIYASQDDIAIGLGRALFLDENVIKIDQVPFDAISDIKLSSVNDDGRIITNFVREALKSGQHTVIALSTANDVANKAFLDRLISFDSIVKVVFDVVAISQNSNKVVIENVLDVMAYYDLMLGVSQAVLEKYYVT